MCRKFLAHWNTFLSLLKKVSYELYLCLYIIIYILFFEFFMYNAIKMLNGPAPDNFHLDDYVVVVSSNTRASTSNHLKRVQLTIPRLNSTKFFYFNRVVKIWNALPPLDLTLPYATIKKQILSIFWQYFLHTYDVDTPCTWCLVCFCSKCSSLPALPISNLMA